MDRLQSFELYCLARWVLAIFGSIYAPLKKDIRGSPALRF
jgi:hypothetical protein